MRLQSLYIIASAGFAIAFFVHLRTFRHREEPAIEQPVSVEDGAGNAPEPAEVTGA